MSGSVEEPDSIGIWLTDGVEVSDSFAYSLSGYEEKDFAHLIAENIYPDNHLQIVQVGNQTLPEMNVVFLGSDPDRSNGNRSRLMNFYFLENRDFLSDPVYIGEDDDTADFEPYVYHSDRGLENTYLVWRNGTMAFDEDSTFAEIAANTEVHFAQHYVGNEWRDFSQVTDFKDSGYSAVGAKVADDRNGDPIITYYLNSIDDPAGVGSSEHDIYLASREEGEWINRKVFNLSGSIKELESAYFKGKQTIAVAYSDEYGNTKVEAWQDGEKIFERANAANAHFVKSGNGYMNLTWYENGALYAMSETPDDDGKRLTPADMKIPSSDYRIYGKFGSNSIILIGTVSKDSSENAYAIFSHDGGTTWERTDLTDIDKNALVNEIAVAYTYQDEPILFYSVQNYEANYDEEAADASLYLQGENQSSGFTGLQSVMLGQDDARFSDTRTDLYVKARRANQRLIISDVEFNEDDARKGQALEANMTIENRGLYPTHDFYIYLNGELISVSSAYIKAGDTGEVQINIPIPDDAADEPYKCRFEVSSKEDGTIDSAYDTQVGIGHISVKYTHELRYGNEALRYTVTNNGFVPKTVHCLIYDEDSGEKFADYGLYVGPGATTSGTWSLVKGLWQDAGHKNIKAYVVMDDEKIEELDSTRFVSMKGLDEIYLQDLNGLNSGSNNSSGNKTDNNETPQNENKPSIPVPAVTDYKIDPIVQSEAKHETETTGTENTQSPKTEEEKPEVAEKVEEIVETVKENRNYVLFYTLIAIALGLLLMILFLLKRMREEEEE